MTFRKFFLPVSLVAAMSAALPLSAGASTYDDDEDDIYYNPSKQTTTTVKPAQNRTAAPAAVYDYPAADTYVAPGGGLDMDVDTYNRRGAAQMPDSISIDQLEALQSGDTYTYTRRIEQYHNSDVVNGSGDQSLIDSYYSTQPEVNLYVVNTVPTYYPYYGYRGWYSPWYGPSWSLNWGWGYDPWYDWSWGWGPSWGPGWGGPAWGPGWYPGPTPPPYRPSYSWSTPGAARPHGSASRPTGASSTAGRRPGAFSAGATNAARPATLGGATDRRRGSTVASPSYDRTPVSRPAGTNVNSGGNQRGRGNQVARPAQSRPTYNNNNTSRNSYNTGSSRGSGSSWGGSRGGSGGGTHNSGGRGRGR